MNRLNKNLLFFISSATILLASCKKDFDPSTYAPDKPYGGFTNSADIEPQNLVSYWAFDGSTIDSAGNLTAANSGTSFGAGIKNQALQNTADSYLLFQNPGAVANLTSYTISFWMNAPQNTSYGYGILSLNNSKDFWGSLDIYLDNGSTPDTANFRVHMNNGNAKNSGQFVGVKIGGAWDKWVHMAVTYDSSTTAGTNFNIYQNGVNVYSALLKDTTNNYGPLQFVNATAMVIGTWQFQTDPSLTESATAQPWAGSFNGLLDEFRIYSKPLTAAEVSSLYKLEKAGR